jgi:molecular chaperone HtpG
MNDTNTPENNTPIAFKAETRQLLDILIHSLYTERGIFLRELISNASDALTRLDFEILTNHEIQDAQAELAIRILPNKEDQTLTISDTGIGMTADEMVRNLGTIAQSGAREFINAAQQSSKNVTDLIGQFGVGFYSAFMVAEWIRVVSRSYQKDAQAAVWFCTGSDTYTVAQTEKEQRGTDVIIKLKEDATEFLEEHRLREIIRKHSDFIPFPIYIGDSTEQANRQTAIWRQNPREVESKDYDEFYQQLTLDFESPLTYTHLVVDAPVQLYSILYVPSKPERNVFSLRKEDGLKLYARKILIQEYHKDLLPEYLGFIQGVVDTEDLPLNVSRESVQSNRVMAQLKKLVTNKALDMLKKLAKDDPEKYQQFWQSYDRYIKQGIAIEPNEPETLYPLLRFRTTHHPDQWSSLDDYVQRMQPDQEQIYYIMGDDEHSILYSPHLDMVRHYDYEVLLFTDPVDAFMLAHLDKYQDHPLINVANADLRLPDGKENEDEARPAGLAEADQNTLIERFKTQLGDKVTDVRMTERLSDSPARLVDPEGAPNQEMQRVYRLLNRDFETPKKILELNPRHPLLVSLNNLDTEQSLSQIIIEQIYEDALLIEGLHPDPASMISRIQKLMEAAVDSDKA